MPASLYTASVVLTSALAAVHLGSTPAFLVPLSSPPPPSSPRLNVTVDSKIVNPVATLPLAYRFRISAGPDWSGVSVL